MKNLMLIFLLTFFSKSHAQYYYKDILGTEETNSLMQKMVSHKVKTVQLTSFEADGSFTEGFYVAQQVGVSPYTLKTTTRSGSSDESVLVSFFDEKLRLVRTVDSSQKLVAHATYTYNEKGKLSLTKTWVTDSLNNISNTEEHEWVYNDKDRLVKMIRRKNAKPIDEIQFVYDEQGNLIEEQTMKDGKTQDNLYYYYNDKNLLTDIVRFNARAQRLLPDYLFEYSPSGQLIQKITVPTNSNEYLIWRYQYNEKGLKSKEVCYNKNKDLLGRIDFTYTFFQ